MSLIFFEQSYLSSDSFRTWLQLLYYLLWRGVGGEQEGQERPRDGEQGNDDEHPEEADHRGHELGEERDQGRRRRRPCHHQPVVLGAVLCAETLSRRRG